MRLNKIFPLSFLLIGLVIPVAAQQVLTLENAIRVALNNNFDILLAKNDLELAANNERYIFSNFLPTLNGSATRTWSTINLDQKFSNGNSINKNGVLSNNTNAAVNLNWTLFDGLKMFAARDYVVALRSAGEISLKGRIVNTLSQIINAYFDIVRQQQQLKAIAEQLSISEERVKITDRKFNAGLGAKVDLLQAKVDLNAQKAAYLRQQTLIEQSKVTLNNLMGWKDTDLNYSVADSIPVKTDLNIDSLRPQVAKLNPDLQLAQQSIDLSRIALRQARAGYFPTLSLTSSYSLNRQESKAGFFLYNQNIGLNYGVTASVPLFNGLDVRRQTQNARLTMQYRQLNYDKQRQAVDADLQKAYKDYRYYLQALQLEEENLDIAKENVMVALERFRQGQSTTLEIKEAQKSLEDAYYRLITARYNAKASETALLRLKGDLVKEVQ